MFRGAKNFLKEMLKSANDIYFFTKKHPKDDFYYFSRLLGCCHILDKGCYTVPFQKGHGKRIYDEAKSFIKKITRNAFFEDPSYLWCMDKMKKWEDMQTNPNCAPVYPHKISYSDSSLYISFIKSNVSARNFTATEIDDSLIESCIISGQSVPCACFMQTVRCYAVKTKTVIESLSPHILGLTGFSDGIPLLFCISADIRPYECLNRQLPYIDGSLFCQNLILSLRANNIYSTVLNFGQASKKDIKEVKKIIGIPDYEKIIVFVAAGYCDKVPEKPVRMSVEKIGKII